MKYIIKDRVLKNFSWKGTREKDPFIAFSHINDILKNAIHTEKDPYTDHDHNKCMIEYVKHAPFRFKASTTNKDTKKQKCTSKIVQEIEENDRSENDRSDDDEINSGEEDFVDHQINENN